MAWTEDRVETLKKLWADGLSASQIAKQLGGVTRNAVIGKVHRLGLSGRATPSRPTRRAPTPRPAAARASKPAAAPSAAKPAIAKKPSAPSQPRIVKEVAPELPAEPVEAKRLENGEYATVLTLREGMCKWPIGDPANGEFRFCGHPVKPGSTYCEAHSAQAYQPQTRRKRKPADDARAVLDSLQSSRRVNF